MGSNNVLWPGTRNCGIHNVTLKMNECCLDIFSGLTTEAHFLTRSLECVNCNFTIQKTLLRPDRLSSYILNTEYSLEFYLDNGTDTICRRMEKFGSMGTYFWNISDGDCKEIQVKEPPESEGVDAAVVFSTFFGIILAYYLYKCVLTRKCRHSARRSVSFRELETDLGNPDIMDESKTFVQARARRQSRIATVDVFRGVTIFIMIFVNYGGGGYPIFRHAVWDGLTIADLVFPWFLWLMGVSVALSLRSKLRNCVSRRKIFCHIIRRSAILITMGIILNSSGKIRYVDGGDSLNSLRIPGVLQRIGATYFIVALTELIFMKPQRNEQFGPWCFCADVVDSAVQWIIAVGFAAAHVLLTLFLPVPGCPTGYLGPGGLHEYSKYENCTGGAAGYIDRLLFTGSHLYRNPTCEKIYHNPLPYDPEGVLGILSSVFCTFLGVHVGRIILCFQNTSSRIRRWLLSAVILGIVGGLLCNFFKNDGLVPVNKNLWSVSYVCVTSSFASVVFSMIYWIVDYRRLCGGLPFLYAGMNALALYVGHEVFKKFLPWSWTPFTQMHLELLMMNLSGALIWLAIAYLLYRRNIFIAL